MKRSPDNIYAGQAFGLLASKPDGKRVTVTRWIDILKHERGTADLTVVIRDKAGDYTHYYASSHDQDILIEALQYALSGCRLPD